MHLKFYSIIAIVCFFILWNRAIAQTTPANIPTKNLTNADKDGISSDWYSKAMENIKQLEEKFYIQKNGIFRVANTTNRLGFLVNSAGYTVQNIRQQQEEATWKVDFTFQGIGRSGIQWKPAG